MFFYFRLYSVRHLVAELNRLRLSYQFRVGFANIAECVHKIKYTQCSKCSNLSTRSNTMINILHRYKQRQRGRRHIHCSKETTAVAVGHNRARRTKCLLRETGFYFHPKIANIYFSLPYLKDVKNRTQNMNTHTHERDLLHWSRTVRKYLV